MKISCRVWDGGFVTDVYELNESGASVHLFFEDKVVIIIEDGCVSYYKDDIVFNNWMKRVQWQYRTEYYNKKD